MNYLGSHIAYEAYLMYQEWEKYKCKEEKENIVKCEGDYKFLYKNTDNLAWCSAFVSSVIARITKKLGYKSKLTLTTSTAQMYNNAKTSLRVDKKPVVGAVFYRRYDDGYAKDNKMSVGGGHVGIIYEVGNGKVRTIEGNVGNAVKVVEYDESTFINGKPKVYSNGHYVIHTEEEYAVSKPIQLPSIHSGQTSKPSDDYYSEYTKYTNKKNRNYYLK